jgi:hypothetical protein
MAFAETQDLSPQNKEILLSNLDTFTAGQEIFQRKHPSKLVQRSYLTLKK